MSFPTGPVGNPGTLLALLQAMAGIGAGPPSQGGTPPPPAPTAQARLGETPPAQAAVAPAPTPTLAQAQMQAYGPRAQGAPAQPPAGPPPAGLGPASLAGASPALPGQQPPAPMPGIVPPGPASGPLAQARFSPFLPQPPAGFIGPVPDFIQQVTQQAPNAQYTSAASSAALGSPSAAMELLLGQRGISPGSTVGKLYMEQGQSLPELFRLMGQGNPNDFGAFSEGLMNAQFTRDSSSRNIGQAAKLAAEDSLTNPASPQYQRYKQITETSDQQGQRGPWGFWHMVVKPALMANNASNLDLKSKEAQFEYLIRTHETQNLQAVNLGQPQLSFQEFLTSVDYKPVDW